MNGAREPGFGAHLGAIMRARRAVSASQRRESPTAWWLKRCLIALGAAWVVLGAFASSVQLTANAQIDPARAAVLFLMGPLGVAALLMAGRLRPEAGLHPLGEARMLLPLSRWQSAMLAVAEDVLSGETVFMLLLGWAPWWAMLAAGENWLTASGWAAAMLAPLVAVTFRQLLVAVQAWAAAASDGPAGAAIRVAVVLVFVVAPFGLGFAAEWLAIGTGDIFSLPLLRWTNSPLAAPTIAGCVAAGLALAGWIRSRRAPRWLRGFAGMLRLYRIATPDASFGSGTPEVAMFRMMVVQATRLSGYRYAVLLMFIFGAFAAVLPEGPGPSLLLFSAFFTPMNALYNVYGGDSRHYVLWLASGRSLSEWTVARQAFHGCHFLLFSVAGITVVGLTGGASAGILGGIAAGSIIALEIALLAGPPISRFVVTPQTMELAVRGRGQSSSRTWVSATLACGTGVVAAALALPAAMLGAGWVGWGVAVLLGAVIVVTRPARGRWTWALRERMALAFRA